jgi:hypothetical protein
MSKILLLAAAVLTAAACAAPPTNREATSATNVNSAAAATPAAPLTEADAIAKEKQIWDALQKKDYDAFGSMLTDDFIYVASDAVYDKAGSINGVKSFEPSEVTFADWKFLPLDKDAGVISYTVTVKGKSNGQEIPPQPLRASSAFVNRDGKWLAIYHQDTEVKKMPPAPSLQKVQKAAPSPASTPAATSTSSDVVANEKAVWAALKAKDYDAFASFLAPESIEVETDGVYDKAGSVKGVQQVDLSKSELSDFKTVKFDDDASLVTYTVKLPGNKPDTEHHSTIWVNRNGKWWAVFHQGTPVMAMPMPKPSASMAKPAATKTPASMAKPAATKTPAK